MTVKLEDSYLFAHMVQALQRERTWTPEMYCVYNDLPDDTSNALIALYLKKFRNARVPRGKRNS